MIAAILSAGLRCRHRAQTTPRRDRQGDYRRCLDCGARLAWRLADGPEFHRHQAWSTAAWRAIYEGDPRLSIEERIRRYGQ